ncbi:MAG TPA: hypothetical protein VHS99_16460 [Chloroflexota bacterium]|nr:hypothetical protein [Chloroflexota bacterium]
MKTPARSCLTLLISLTVLLLQSLLPRAVALAKSPPHLVTVTGARPAEPVEISDEASLVSFNPWTRGFIDWERGSVTSPPAAETTYTASFYLKREGDDLSLIYVLRYLPDPSGGQGFIYIPGPGDPWYRRRTGA